MKHLCTILILAGMAVAGMRGAAQETAAPGGPAAEATLAVVRVDLDRMDPGQMFGAVIDVWQKIRVAGQLDEEQSARFDSLFTLIPQPAPAELMAATAAVRAFAGEMKRRIGTTECFFVIDQDALPSLPLIIAVRENPVISKAYIDPKFHQWLRAPFGIPENNGGFVARRGDGWFFFIPLMEEMRLPGAAWIRNLSDESGRRPKEDITLRVRRADEWFRGRVPNPNPAIEEALAMLRSADGAPEAAVQAVVVVPPYAKRLIAQIDPTLPEPLEAVHVAALTKIRWAAMAVDPARMEFFCAVQTDDAAADDEFSVALDAIRGIVKESLRPLAGTIFLALIEPGRNPDPEGFFADNDTSPELRAQWERLSAQWVPLCDAVVERILPSPVDGRCTLRINPENTLTDVRPEFVEWIRISATVGPETLIAQAARRACTHNLRKIGLAFHSYYATRKEFPPAYTVDADGKPLHSWRVLILPFIEHQAMYDAIRLDEPWDSQWNRQFHDRMPDVYRCGAYLPKEIGETDAAALKSLTPYCLVTGEETYTLPLAKMILHSMLDGTSNTILVTERRRPVCWMAPVDLPQEKAFEGPGADDGIGSPHPGGFNTAFADGSVRFLRTTISLENLRAILTKAGGEAF